MDNHYQEGADIGGILQGVLSNPAALSMLTNLLGNLQKQPNSPPAQEAGCGCGAGGPPPPPCDPCPKAPPLLPPISPPAPPHHRPKDDRAGLLQALRPFLSPERCDLLDTLLRVMELMELFRRRR